eukprot:gnl/TRDRNA2_/TRDRNA2_164780_c0_seq2.p1 gnl/TRDRNA2_/TRDRNA2_164780_c0~~gnl/TRDRNA2_/TRDRNA2_164780_c0_seq2.p1  ORF type:complete len:349 (+),score=47.48 gnl/TRDRNA2_/TRDRNA2_164780_c0_seq2:68-1114(+)
MPRIQNQLFAPARFAGFCTFLCFTIALICIGIQHMGLVVDRALEKESEIITSARDTDCILKNDVSLFLDAPLLKSVNFTDMGSRGNHFSAEANEIHCQLNLEVWDGAWVRKNATVFVGYDWLTHGSRMDATEACESVFPGDVPLSEEYLPNLLIDDSRLEAYTADAPVKASWFCGSKGYIGCSDGEVGVNGTDGTCAYHGVVLKEGDHIDTSEIMEGHGWNSFKALGNGPPCIVSPAADEGKVKCTIDKFGQVRLGTKQDLIKQNQDEIEVAEHESVQEGWRITVLVFAGLGVCCLLTAFVCFFFEAADTGSHAIAFYGATGAPEKKGFTALKDEAIPAGEGESRRGF